MNKTYGFIKVINNGIPYDVFVHSQNINTKGETTLTLKKRDVVSFNIKQEKSGEDIKHVAYNVVLIQEGPINTPVSPPKVNSPGKKWTNKGLTSPDSKSKGKYMTSPSNSRYITSHHSGKRNEISSANNTPISSPSKRLNPDAVEFKFTSTPVKITVSKGPLEHSIGFGKKDL